MTAYKHKKYRLSIQFALDGFSFLVYNPEKLRIVQEKEIIYSGKEKFYDWLKVKLAGEEAFRQDYRGINVLYTPTKHTLVPNLYLEDKKEKELFSLTFPLEETEMIESESIGDNTLLSSMKSELYNLVADYFPKAEKKTTPTLLLEHVQNKKSWNVAVLVLYNKLHITIIKDEKVQLSNSFDFKTKDDLLYYILYVFDNFSIPVAESSIQLFGNQNYLPLLKSELSRYHNGISYLTSFNGIISKLSMGNLLLLNL